jgi:RND family efflux transporter MFP subunit
MTAEDEQKQAPAEGAAAPHTEETDPRIVWGGAAAIMALLALTFFLSHGEESTKKEKAVTAPSVTVITVSEQRFAQRLSLSGEARPTIDVRVFAPTSGVRVTQLLVDEGAMVRQGQPLARLDTRVANAQLSAAQASVAEARSAQVRARDEYRRAESIKDSGALSVEAINARKAAAAAADARLAAARAQLAEVNARLEGGYIRAPNAGLVLSRTAQVGQLVDGQALFRIAGGNRLEVGVEIGEADMLLMRPGQAASFRLVDGAEIVGRLRRLPASIDSRTRTGEAVFDLPANPKLRAGMFMRGEAELPPRNVVAAPQAAIVYEDRQASVYVVAQNNRVKRTPVELGARTADSVAVTSGLSPGQTIVAGGAAFLQDGDAVTPVRAPPLAPAAKQSSLRGRSDG